MLKERKSFVEDFQIREGKAESFVDVFKRRLDIKKNSEFSSPFLSKWISGGYVTWSNKSLNSYLIIPLFSNYFQSSWGGKEVVMVNDRNKFM